MSRVLSPVLALAMLIVGGCGEVAENAPQPMDALQVMKAPFTPPEGGHLTEELMERYLGVLEERRAVLEKTDSTRFLDPPAADATKNQKKVRTKVLGEALTKAQMNMGVPISEMGWVRKRLAMVRKNRIKNAAADTPDGAEVALVDDYQESLAAHP